MINDLLYDILENQEENVDHLIDVYAYGAPIPLPPPGAQAVNAEEEPVIVHPHRLIRDRLDMLYVRDVELIKNYRFPRHLILEIMELVNDEMERPTQRSFAIPVITQVLASLRLLASGSFQNIIADIVGVSQPSMSRILKRFLRAMLPHREQFIFFPFENPQWVERAKNALRAIANINGGFALMDGVHILLKTPAEDAIAFKNRKGQPSVNVQLISGSDREALDVVARWPGSTHDSFMWAQSGIRQRLMDSNVEGFIIADGGYPCERRVLTPYRNPTTIRQRNFNVALSRTRISAEHVNGIMKMIFRAIDKSGGYLQYDTETVCQMYVVCAMLYNKRLRARVPLPPEALAAAADGGEHQQVPEDEPDHPDGIALRNAIAATFPDDHLI